MSSQHPTLVSTPLLTLPSPLPPPLLSLLHSHLGFIQLMDCRAVSRHFKRQCERAALQWMIDQFTEAAIRRRHEQLIDENKGQEKVMDRGQQSSETDTEVNTLPYYDTDDHSTPFNQLPDDLEHVANKLSTFSFSVSDAVWLVQQCRRWQANNTGDDPSTYWVSQTRAWIAYNTTGGCEHRWCNGITSFPLMSLAADLFVTRGHADQFAPHLREGVTQTQREVQRWPPMRCADEQALMKLEVQEHERKTLMDRWMSSSTGRPLVMQLPSSVIIHSILPFIDFEPLIVLRRVSRSFQPLVESAVVVWMNRTFPTGLALVDSHHSHQNERRKEHGGDEHTMASEKVTGKRKRGGQVVACSSSSPSSSTSSSSTTSSPSYTVVDAMWAYHQLQWCRLLPWNERVELILCASPSRVIIRRGEVCWFYPLTVDDYRRRFGRRLTVSLVEVLDLVLSVHGSDTSRVRRLQREHRAELKWQRWLLEEKEREERRVAEEAERHERMVVVDRALAEVELEADWTKDGQQWQWGRVTFRYVPIWQCWKSKVDDMFSCREVTGREMEDEIKLHRAMTRDGMLQCGEWGACMGQRLYRKCNFGNCAGQ
jgi:hypothetical protein